MAPNSFCNFVKDFLKGHKIAHGLETESVMVVFNLSLNKRNFPVRGGGRRGSLAGPAREEVELAAAAARLLLVISAEERKIRGTQTP